ncbi:MAG: hypothetical protein R3F37_14795 [Candidatus Competibacteraceae bacterium]
MADNIENIILEHLKALRNEVKSLREEMHEEFKDVKLRLHGVETAVVKVRSDNLGAQEPVFRLEGLADSQ